MESMSSYFSTGLTGAVTLSIIAFTTVFLVLTGLTFIILGVRYLAAPFEKRGAPPRAPEKGKSSHAPARSAPSSAPVSTPAPAGGTAPPSAVEKGKVVAAITAALSEHLQEGLRISSIEPVAAEVPSGRPQGSLWKQAGIIENLARLDRQPWRH